MLNFLHSMPLSTSNKQWLADHLHEEVKAERKAATTASGWVDCRSGEFAARPEGALATNGTQEFACREFKNL